MYNIYAKGLVFEKLDKKYVTLYIRKYSGLKLRYDNIETILNNLYKSKTAVIIVNNYNIRVDYVGTL